MNKFLGYIIYQPDHDDYLALENSDSFFDVRAYTPHPANAFLFKKLKQAKNYIKSKPEKNFQLCLLHDLGDQYAVEMFEGRLN